MKRALLYIIGILGWGFGLEIQAQDISLKTNTLYWLSTTPNIGMEIALSRKSTIDLTAAYNPWTFKDGDKLRFWLLQPEVRYWFCEKFEGHFAGVHLHGAQFFGELGSKRYDGYLAGAGLTYGYQWILSPHWNLEAAVGIGYAHLWYKESERIPCLKCYRQRHKNYFGPTKAAVSLIYIF